MSDDDSPPGDQRTEDPRADDRRADDRDAVDRDADAGDERPRAAESEFEYSLADLAEREDAAAAEEELDFPSGDDPVSPQSIDAENAAFVLLGLLGMVGLFLHLLLGVF